VLPYFGSVPAADAFPRARAALARALELDSTLAEAYVSMAALMATDWDWPGAVRHFARAVALAPNDASARQWYGESLIALGRTDDALAEMRRARALDPRSAIIASDLGWFLLTARRYDDALPEFRAAIALDGRFAHAYEGLGCAYREMGRLDDAIAALRRAVALSPAGDVGRGYLGHALAVAGRAAEARRLLASLERARADGPGGEGGRGPPGWAIAAIHAGLGARDSALAWLDVAYRQRDPAMAYVKVDPVFAPLRDDARYRALLGRMGLAPARR
jgi:serine/threonine-protein kinase